MKINILPIDKEITASKKEKQIIHVALINILSLLNALVTQKGMVWNPLSERDSENLGFEVFLAHETTAEQKEEFVRRVTNQVTAFLKMADIPYDLEME